MDKQKQEKSYRSIEARAQSLGMSREEFVASKQQEPRQILLELGFTEQQVNDMFKERSDRLNINIPFSNTDIRQRYADFLTVFEPYKVSPTKIREMLSAGLMFSQDPRQYKILFQFIENKGISVKKFLQIAKTENGRSVLARTPTSIIQNITTMSEVLAPFGMTAAKWIEMSLFRPTLLRQTPDYLCENINTISQYFERHGYTKADWIEAGMDNPGCLDRNTDTILTRQAEMSAFLAPYGVTPADWIQACLKKPQLFYTTSEYLQSRFKFYIDAYEAGDFVFTKLEKQDTRHLIKTLLTSPQYLICDDANLEARREYMEQKKRRNEVATSAVVYRTLGYIKKCLQRGG